MKSNYLTIRFVLHVMFFSAWLLLVMHAKTISAKTKSTRSTYIVHMDKSHMPETSKTHHHWYSSIVDTLKNNDEKYSSPTILYSYDAAFHGFSATLSPEELQTLEAHQGFVSAYKSQTVKLATTRSPDFLSLRPSSGIWPVSKFGEDVIIGVVDTGVWPESESFNDRGMSPNIPAKWKGKCEEGTEFNSSMCNLKLIGARFFSKGFTAQNNITVAMNSPRDTNGHGTHVASTAAGNSVTDVSFFSYAKGTATGIAPRARVAVYKMLFEEGGGTSADMVAAIDAAIEDGVDILSISVTFGTRPLHNDPIAIASFAAMERGIVVSAAAGNEGPDLGTVKNGAPWLITVAAGSMDRSFGGTVRLGNGVQISGWTLFPASALIEGVPLVYNKTLSACNSTKLLSEARFDGIIVCNDTGFDLQQILQQIDTVVESQVMGAIFISASPRLFELGKLPCPGAVISPEEAPVLIKYAQTMETPIISIKTQQTFLGTKPAPTASSYSSRGPSNVHHSILKPDIMAPGTRVLAAWVPIAKTASIGPNVELSGDYNLISGTSMACPHVSGIAAMLRAIHPKWSPAAIRSAIMTTTNPLDNTGKPITDDGDEEFGPATPLAIGSGHVEPNTALDPGLVYDLAPQDYINLLCSMNFTREQLITITRLSTYDCSNPSSDLNYPSFMALYDENNSTKATLVRKFERVVTNVGDGPASYNVSVKAPVGSVVRVSPQRLVFGKTNENQKFRVTIKYDSKYEMHLTGRVTFGELVWVEENGNHRVRSPIVISPSVHE